MKVEQLYTNCLAEAAYYIESNGEAAIVDPLREYGPYIKKGKDNYKIPKDKTAGYLTLEDIQMIIGEQGPTKKGKSFRGRKKY